MPYTTRCPACGTTFRVVADQLKVSDGWVRCGHCADVFDATLYLQEWVPPPSQASTVADPVADGPMPASAVSEGTQPADPPAQGEPSPQAPQPFAETAPSPLSTPSPGAAPAVLPDAFDRAAGVAPAPQAGSSPEAGVGPFVAQDASDFQADLERFARAAGRTPVEAAVQPGPVAAPLPEVEPDPDPEPGPKSALPPSPADAAVPEEPGFVRQARRQAFWRSPGVRAALAMLALALAGLMAVQWALHERDQLAARHPPLAPLLAQMCASLGCEVGPVRRIDAVVIDSSRLARRLGSFYAFDVVLKNNADMAVATPALELSLTDTRDQVIARRVFLPAELPGAPGQLSARQSVSLSLRLSIDDIGPASMAGYRALLFYP